MEGLALELGIEAIKFLVGGFWQQLNEQNRLIGDAQSQAKELGNDLDFLKEYLEKSDNLHTSSSVITNALISDIRESTYRAEDAIDSFVAEAAASDANCFSGGISKSKLAKIAELINSVCEKVKEIRLKVERFDEQITNTGHPPQNQGLGEYKGPPAKQEYAPIFKTEKKVLKVRLTEEAEKTQAIFITGTHGIGKTALAAAMFYDSDIRKQFNVFIWVSVSNPSARNIFLAVLKQFDKLSDPGLLLKPDSELSELVARCLEGNTFLLVLDNVSEIVDWTMLRSAFERSGKKSKVLITSNNEETARVIDRHNRSVHLSPLNGDDSWILLEWLIFEIVNGCPSELARYGRLLSDCCKGLPQVIVFVGNILAKKDLPADEMRVREKVWQAMSVDMITYFDELGSHNSNMQSSYNKLPYHLRACFLYLGIFPEQTKISVSKLIRLWIAEGFVEPRAGVALEKVAEEYLMDLNNRNLVKIEEKRPNGSPKTCSLNLLLYEFCKAEAGNKMVNFFQEFRKSSSDATFNPSIEKVNEKRRICIHGHVSKFFPKFISRHHNFNILRSFVTHSNEEYPLSSSNISNIRAAFKLLRVLDAKPIKFKQIPSGLCQLVHLRYVTLSIDGAILPASISKLQKIRTLVVHTTSPTLKIKADILKMLELRHLKTNASATLPKISKATEECEQLQLLSDISPKSCTQELFDKTPYLKKLGIRGQLSLLLDRKEMWMKLQMVEKLKLLNDVTRPPPENKLDSLLAFLQLLPNIKSLTMSATSLDWVHISILGSLQNLEELKLRDNAFVGEKWEVTGKGFPNLQILHIECLDFQLWKSSGDHFCNLTRLKLSECKQLNDVPIELADVRAFQELHLVGGNLSATKCVKKIEQKKKEMKKTDKSIVFTLFERRSPLILAS